MNESQSFSTLSDWAGHIVRMLEASRKDGTDAAPSVCVIGSGPAGLQAAASLSVHGFSVTVHEALPAAGSTLLRVPAADGSSACRETAVPLSEKELASLIAACAGAGINLVCSSPAGQADFDRISARFDFVIYACGRAAVFPTGPEGHLRGNIYAVGSCVKNGKICTADEAAAAASRLAACIARISRPGRPSDSDSTPACPG